MISVKVEGFMHSNLPLLIHIVHYMKGTKGNSQGLDTSKLIIYPRRSAKGFLWAMPKAILSKKNKKSKPRSILDIRLSFKKYSVLFMNKE